MQYLCTDFVSPAKRGENAVCVGLMTWINLFVLSLSFEVLWYHLLLQNTILWKGHTLCFMFEVGIYSSAVGAAFLRKGLVGRPWLGKGGGAAAKILISRPTLQHWWVLLCTSHIVTFSVMRILTVFQRYLGWCAETHFSRYEFFYL